MLNNQNAYFRQSIALLLALSFALSVTPTLSFALKKTKAIPSKKRSLTSTIDHLSDQRDDSSSPTSPKKQRLLSDHQEIQPTLETNLLDHVLDNQYITDSILCYLNVLDIFNLVRTSDRNANRLRTFHPTTSNFFMFINAAMKYVFESHRFSSKLTELFRSIPSLTRKLIIQSLSPTRLTQLSFKLGVKQKLELLSNNLGELPQSRNELLELANYTGNTSEGMTALTSIQKDNFKVFGGIEIESGRTLYKLDLEKLTKIGQSLWDMWDSGQRRKWLSNIYKNLWSHFSPREQDFLLNNQYPSEEHVGRLYYHIKTNTTHLQ